MSSSDREMVVNPNQFRHLNEGPLGQKQNPGLVARAHGEVDSDWSGRSAGSEISRTSGNRFGVRSYAENQQSGYGATAEGSRTDYRTEYRARVVGANLANRLAQHVGDPSPDLSGPRHPLFDPRPSY